jgi:ribosome-associated toxin RatA of RatAB toxin-antitoxin module
MQSQSHSEVIGAPIQSCFDAIIDFERYPEWFSGITAAEILEADESANKWTVRYELNMVIKTITYTLAYEADPPTLIRWRLVAGDLNAVEGTYALESLEADVTEASCTQSIDIGFWIPGPIKRTFEKSALIDSVRELKTAVEAGLA